MRNVLIPAIVSLCLGAAGAHAGEKITVYTSQPSEQMAPVIQLFNKINPDIQVDLFRSGTTEVLNKLQAEAAAGAPKADILLIADSVAMQGLKAQGLLKAYPKADVSRLPAGQFDPDKTWFGTKLITTGIVYNTKTGAPKPASWNDLLKAEAKGQVIVPSPLYSGAAVIHVGTMAQKAEFGWKYFEDLAKNGAVTAKGNGAVRDAVARGEKAYGIIIEYMAYDAKTKGSPVDFVFPTEGVTAINQPVAMVAGTKSEAAAAKFIDFQLSREAAEQSVEQAYFPIIKGVEPPKGYPDPASLKIMGADEGRLLKETDAIKSKFADIFGG